MTTVPPSGTTTVVLAEAICSSGSWMVIGVVSDASELVKVLIGRTRVATVGRSSSVMYWRFCAMVGRTSRTMPSEITPTIGSAMKLASATSTSKSCT